jgi:hypothetical protein
MKMKKKSWKFKLKNEVSSNFYKYRLHGWGKRREDKGRKIRESRRRR